MSKNNTFLVISNFFYVFILKRVCVFILANFSCLSRIAIVVEMESPEPQKLVVLVLKKRPQKLFLVHRTTAFVVRTCNEKHGHRH